MNTLPFKEPYKPRYAAPADMYGPPPEFRGRVRTFTRVKVIQKRQSPTTRFIQLPQQRLLRGLTLPLLPGLLGLSRHSLQRPNMTAQQMTTLSHQSDGVGAASSSYARSRETTSFICGGATHSILILYAQHDTTPQSSLHLAPEVRLRLPPHRSPSIRPLQPCVIFDAARPGVMDDILVHRIASMSLPLLLT